MTTKEKERKSHRTKGTFELRNTLLLWIVQECISWKFLLKIAFTMFCLFLRFRFYFFWDEKKKKLSEMNGKKWLEFEGIILGNILNERSIFIFLDDMLCRLFLQLLDEYFLYLREMREKKKNEDNTRQHDVFFSFFFLLLF